MPENVKQPERSLSEQAQMDALLRTFPNGLVVENDHGYAFINRLRQPLSQPHGLADMERILQFSPLFDSIMEMHIGKKEDTLAFDTETSGLSNGSGSFIFMMGLGYFEEDNYIVDQLILPDLSAESAFLRQTELIFSRYPVLLSYNGKSFDIPMLQSRLNFHLFPDFTKSITHIDLLNLTRRYWKHSLGSVRLANIEQYILSLQRGDEEVPGYLAPELYRDFLRDGDAEHISGVAYHNQIDVVSLSAFLLYLNDLAVRGESDPAVMVGSGMHEPALLRHNLSFFSGKIISEIDGFTDKEKKSIASGFLKSGETEKALPILENLAARGDLDAASKLMKYYLKTKDREKFEQYKTMVIRLIEQDETIGKWSKIDKIEKLQSTVIR